jgi:hypothetical protein
MLSSGAGTASTSDRQPDDDDDDDEALLADTVFLASLSVDDVAAAPNPRRAVLLAYALFERRLDGTPAARTPSATPREWLGRIRRLGDAELTESARTLTVLYERARFGEHRPLRPEDRDRAVRALAALPSHQQVSTSTGGRGF